MHSTIAHCTLLTLAKQGCRAMQPKHRFHGLMHVQVEELSKNVLGGGAYNNHLHPQSHINLCTRETNSI
jgi:hypothetical protein